MTDETREMAPGAILLAQRTFSGNAGLQIEEPLIFEIASTDISGVDLPEQPQMECRLGGLERHAPIGLPGLSEPEAMRHYVRLSQKNYAIDMGIYPLGSCTMKHNPRLNEKVARLPGFADLHPLQPQGTVQGALQVMARLAAWLAELTGMPGVALSPKAGAQGEICGMTAIRAVHEAAGETRTAVLVPDSAHGTTPATAALLGYRVETIPAQDNGTVSAEAVRAALSDDVAGIMLTKPNTCGLFERDIVDIARAVHDAGAYFYCAGANFNAIVGKVRPGDIGIDCMHLNLHKTFSTPHGGGGPGSGPAVFSKALASFAPVSHVIERDGAYALVEECDTAGVNTPFGRLTAFHGQMGMFVRALAYMLGHGADGMRQASEDAVLSANYVRACLSDMFTQPFGDQLCMHEVLFDDSFMQGSGVTTHDFAKALIDEGFHPMTVYFPMVAHGAMLIEPTESESKAALDQFIAVMRDLGKAVREGDVERFTQAPGLAPRCRLDETLAAREPVLRWRADIAP